jgi:hypothetical protein
LHRREHGADAFCDINRESIDTFYYKNLNFDLQSPQAKRFEEILALITDLLKDGKRKKLQSHEAIHLVLLVDALLDGYTRSWTESFTAAFDGFREKLAIDTKHRQTQPGDYWIKYGQHARTNSDRGPSIASRHQFFVTQMHQLMRPKLKDQHRAFGELDREMIYYRDQKRCRVCDAEVTWSDAEVHHVEEHSRGGATDLANGALVHRKCHPKGEAQTAEFARKWKETKQG